MGIQELLKKAFRYADCKRCELQNWLTHREIYRKKEKSQEYNRFLLRQVKKDLEMNHLPVFPKPGADEIRDYERSRAEKLREIDNYQNPDAKKKALANQFIPIEDEIWVDKVVSFYLAGYARHIGSVHIYDAVRKELYKKRGYDWYARSEIFPKIHFD